MKNIFIYIFAIITALAPLWFIKILVIDFFDPNSLSFQMIDLPIDQILLFDTIVLAGYAILYAMFVTFFIKQNVKKLLIASLAIWAYTLLELYIDGNLPHYNV